MSLDVAKQAVDYFLGQEPEEEAVIWEFIGGEPLLEIDLIDQISDYIKQQMYLRNHPWFKNYIFSIGSNGVLYNDSRVQAYLKKNAAHVSVAITIDGTREKHDMNRVFTMDLVLMIPSLIMYCYGKSNSPTQKQK